MSKNMNVFVKLTSIILIILLFYHFNNELMLCEQYDNSSYNFRKAVEYSNRYFMASNSDYLYFETNCTNFVSQCLVAGGIEPDFVDIDLGEDEFLKLIATNEKWYCKSYHFSDDKPDSFLISTSFIRVNDFIKYWEKTKNVRVDYYDLTEENIKKAEKQTHAGDVIAIFSTSDKTDHLAIVSDVNGFGIYYNSNTLNRKEYNLRYVSKNEYCRFAIMHFV
ncbi:MAG: amidase domain-containing protein [Clostridia bacterium]|nr:amidase domain-containing protein [Clostridia bacterium]